MKAIRRMTALCLCLFLIGGEFCFGASALDTLDGSLYTGTYTRYVDAMESSVRFDIELAFAGGKYAYTVKVTVSGNMAFDTVETISDLYSMQGDTVTLHGDLGTARVNGDSLVLNGWLSSYSVEKTQVVLWKQTEKKAEIYVPETKKARVYESFVLPVTADSGAELSFVSSAPQIADVDADGKVTAKAPGTAVITVTAAHGDGRTVQAACALTVRYVWWQWLIRIFLFGFIWGSTD